MALKLKPKPKVQLVPLPRSLVRAGVVSEFVNAFLPKQPTTVKNLQQSVAEGLIASVSITGVDGLNVPRVRYTITLDPLGDDSMVHLDLSNGRSHTEALDQGIAAALAYAVKTMERRKLRADLSFQWANGVSETRKAEVSRTNGYFPTTVQPLPPDEHGFIGSSPMPPSDMPPRPREAPNSIFRTMFNLTAGKDTGIHFKGEEARKKR